MFGGLLRGSAWLAALGVLGVTAAAGVRAHRAELAGDAIAAGVRIEGELVGATPAHEIATRAAARVLDRRLTLRLGARTLEVLTLRELGATADVDRVARDARAVGRRGDWLDRALERDRAEEGAFDLRIVYALPVDALTARLERHRDDVDTRPIGARRVLATGAVTPHQDGRLLDVHATAEALLRAARVSGDEASVELGTYLWRPLATTELARAADTSTTLARFETRHGGPAGRDKNILRAASALDGVVLAPGEAMSFNELVGPRTLDNGFFNAPEIYRGEMREGVGGGSCQVASTLYAAALFAGLEIVERRNHSRPSGYIRPGLDATVAYPVLDLRLRNGFDFPVVLASSSDAGTLGFEVRGRSRPVSVTLATETLGIMKHGRKLEKARLPDGEFRLKQRGKRGLRIKRVTTIAETDGTVRQLESVDVYPPVQEIWLVAPDVDASALPPLEEPADAATSASG